MLFHLDNHLQSAPLCQRSLHANLGADPCSPHQIPFDCRHRLLQIHPEHVRRRRFLALLGSSYQLYQTLISYQLQKKEETTLATLRILELLVKHGDVLIDVINDGILETNVHVWKGIFEKKNKGIVILFRNPPATVRTPVPSVGTHPQNARRADITCLHGCSSRRCLPSRFGSRFFDRSSQ